jgi:hypothetical protein
MEFFALDDEVLRLEQELAHTCGDGRLTGLLTLAWHLRQRDTRRAVDLAHEVQSLLDGPACQNPGQNIHPTITARLTLLQAEAKWLFLELDAAAAEAALALALAHGSNEPQIAALQTLAEIHSAHRLPPPAKMKAPSATLHYLEQALALAEAMPGFIVPPDLLEALANAGERAGLPSLAFRYAKQAISARKKNHSREAANRACALQLSHQNSSAQALAAYQRQLAQANARCTPLQQQACQTLERLGEIGRQMSATPEAEQVFALLQQHSSELLDAARFVIWLLEPNSLHPKMAAESKDGQALASN